VQLGINLIRHTSTCRCYGKILFVLSKIGDYTLLFWTHNKYPCFFKWRHTCFGKFTKTFIVYPECDLSFLLAEIKENRRESSFLRLYYRWCRKA